MTKSELLKLATEQESELIKLTSDLIKINSENPTSEQRTVIDFVKAYLTDAGISVEEVASNEEFPCLVAKIGNDNGKSIILNGHVDVVPAGDLSKWDFDPYCGTITDKLILGRGTSDMKAGVAGILFVMKLLKQVESDLQGNIRLHIVSDEESGGTYGTKWLCESGYADNADACIVAEPTSNNNIEIGQKGSNELVITTFGTSAHGSLGNYKGENAIEKMCKIIPLISQLHTIKSEYSAERELDIQNSKMVAKKKLETPGVENVIDHVTTNVGIINGGTRVNMVPDTCTVKVDVRLPSGVDINKLDQKMKEILAESGVADATYDCSWAKKGNHTLSSSPIVQAIKKNAEQIWNIDVIPAYQWASSDARFYREKGIDTIQYGAANTEGIHSYNENVDIEDVTNAGKIYLLSLCDLLKIN